MTLNSIFHRTRWNLQVLSIKQLDSSPVEPQKQIRYAGYRISKVKCRLWTFLAYPGIGSFLVLNGSCSPLKIPVPAAGPSPFQIEGWIQWSTCRSIIDLSNLPRYIGKTDSHGHWSWQEKLLTMLLAESQFFLLLLQPPSLHTSLNPRNIFTRMECLPGREKQEYPNNQCLELKIIRSIPVHQARSTFYQPRVICNYNCF